jgi:Mn-dependent DtxR family transcriptional regulator
MAKADPKRTLERLGGQRQRYLAAARELQGRILPILIEEVEADRLGVGEAAALLKVKHPVVSKMIARARRRAEREAEASRQVTEADLEAVERRLGS